MFGYYGSDEMINVPSNTFNPTPTVSSGGGGSGIPTMPTAPVTVQAAGAIKGSPLLLGLLIGAGVMTAVWAFKKK